MPPKRLPPNTKVPDFIKARASASSRKEKNMSEIDQLMNMSSSELYPYFCFLAFVILTVLYNFLPFLFRHLVEFQYPIEVEKDESVPTYGDARRPSMQTYGTGVLDVAQLSYLYLAVVSIQIFSAELLQAFAKYVLRSPKRIQESFVTHGTFLIFLTFCVSSAFSLIPEDIFTSNALWTSTGLPISRTFKFYLLTEIAGQIANLVGYLVATPQKTWKPFTILGNAFGIIVTFVAYFAGYFVPSLIILCLFDLTSWLRELSILANCIFYQKKENPGEQLKTPLTVSWIFSRVVSVFLVVVSFWIASPHQQVVSQEGEEQAELPPKFKTLDFALLAGLAVLVAIQLKWLPEVISKIVKKPKTA